MDGADVVSYFMRHVAVSESELAFLVLLGGGLLLIVGAMIMRWWFGPRRLRRSRW